MRHLSFYVSIACTMSLFAIGGIALGYLPRPGSNPQPAEAPSDTIHERIENPSRDTTPGVAPEPTPSPTDHLTLRVPPMPEPQPRLFTPRKTDPPEPEVGTVEPRLNPAPTQEKLTGEFVVVVLDTDRFRDQLASWERPLGQFDEVGELFGSTLYVLDKQGVRTWAPWAPKSRSFPTRREPWTEDDLSEMFLKTFDRLKELRSRSVEPGRLCHLIIWSSSAEIAARVKGQPPIEKSTEVKPVTLIWHGSGQTNGEMNAWLPGLFRVVEYQGDAYDKVVTSAQFYFAKMRHAASGSEGK